MIKSLQKFTLSVIFFSVAIFLNPAFAKLNSKSGILVKKAEIKKSKVKTPEWTYSMGVNNAQSCGVTAIANPSFVCAGASVKFDLNTLTTGASTWVFSTTNPFVTPTSSTFNTASSPATTPFSVTVTPTLTTSTTVVYNVTVTNNGSSCTTAVSFIAYPTPTIVATVPNSCVGNSVVASATNSGSPSFVYNWTLPGGSISAGATTASPTFTASTIGTYNAGNGNPKVVVTDSKGCSASATPTYVVNGTTASAVANPTTICANASSTLTVSPASGAYTSGATFTWKASSGSNPSGNPATVSPSASTTYNVTVSDNGCPGTAAVVVTINPSPSVTITPETLCQNATKNFSTVINPSSASITWSNGLSGNTPQIPTGTAGTTTYYATVTDAGCTGTASAVVVISPAIAASVKSVVGAPCGGKGTAEVCATGGINGNYTFDWSGTGTQAPAKGSPSGCSTYTDNPATYSVIVYDAGCTFTLTPVTIPAVGGPTITPTYTDPSCNGTKDGTIQVPYMSPTANNTFILTLLPATTVSTVPVTAASGTLNFTGLAAGTYSIKLTDANGCSTGAQLTLTNPLLPTVVVTPQPNCNGQGQGTASVSFNNFSGTVNPSISPGGTITTTTITGLSGATVYTATGTAGGCSASTTFTINQFPQIQATVTPTQATCVPPTGRACVDQSPTGGNGSYSYNWSNGASTQCITAGAGPYTVTVSSAGCFTTVSTNIAPAAGGPVITTTLTSGNPVAGTGTLTVNFTGGTGPFAYTVTPNGPPSPGSGSVGSSPLVISDVKDQVLYKVCITDANGCNVCGDVFIPPIDFTAVATNLKCPNKNSATISVEVTSGTSPFTFAISGPPLISGVNAAPSKNAPFVINVTSAGTYTMTLTDANSNIVKSVVVDQPLTPTVVFSQNAAIKCFGDPASFTATGTFNPGAPAYSWTGGTGTQAGANYNNVTFPGTSGIVTLNVLDAANCPATASLPVTQPPALTFTATAKDLTCFGSTTTGTITISNVQGGTAPYTGETIAPGPVLPSMPYTAPSIDFSPTPTGVFIVKVTDSNACSATRNATVSQPQAIDFSTSVTHAVCGLDGSIQVSVDPVLTGAGPNYTYSSTAGPTQGPIPANSATFGKLNGSATPYSITVTDKNGCEAVHVATVTQPAGKIPALGSSKAVSCQASNASGTLTSDGAQEITIAGGTPNFTWGFDPSTPGNPAGVPTAGPSRTVSFTGLTPGNYTITVSDASGGTCNAGISFTIAAAPAFAVSPAISATNVSCAGANDAKIEMCITGGNAGTPTFGSNPALPPPSGSGCFTFNNIAVPPTQNVAYTIVATDSKGCTVQASTSVSSPSQVAPVLVPTDSKCGGASDGTITISTTGGSPNYDYNWTSGGIPPASGQSGASSTISNLGPNTYTVSVTDMRSCPTVVSIIITEPSAVAPLTSPVIICSGQQATLDVTSVNGGTGPYTKYEWFDSNGASIYSGASSSFTLPAINNTGTTNTTQVFTVTVTDINNCTGPQTQTVTIRPDIKFTTDPSKFCADANGSSTLRVLNLTGGLGAASTTYIWRDNNNNIVQGPNGQDSYQTPPNPLTTKTNFTYFVEVGDGCTVPSVIKQVDVTAYPQPIAQFSQTNYGCSPLSVNLSAGLSNSDGTKTNYKWSINGASQIVSNSPNLSPSPTLDFNTLPGVAVIDNGIGNFMVSLETEYDPTIIPNCKNTKTVPIQVFANPVPEIASSANPITNVKPAVLFEVNPMEKSTLNDHSRKNWATYQWAITSTVANFTTITSPLINDAGNPTNDPANPKFNYQNYHTYGKELGAEGDYLIYVTVSAAYADPANPGTRIMCRGTDTYVQSVKEITEVWIPNVFTPNGDNINDEFGGIVFNGTSYEMFIYDRWGNMLFKSNDPKDRWKGIDDKGKMCQQDVYAYLITVTDYKGEKLKPFVGKVTLIR